MPTIDEEPVETSSDEETAAETETPTTDEDILREASLAAFKNKHIFISHKCDVDLDEGLARKLYEDLVAFGADVYLDKAQPIGVPYDEAIDQSLESADFVLALLTKDSNQSDWVRAELSHAHKLSKKNGLPKIIPIKIGQFELSSTIRAVCGGINFHTYQAGDYDEIISDVKASINNDFRLRKRAVIGLEGFLVGEFRKTLTRAASLDSSQLRHAGQILRKEKLFWVVGDSGARNHFARVLAVREFDSLSSTSSDQEKGPGIYEVPWSFNWSKVDDTFVSDSILIFPDVKPAMLFGEELAGSEIKALKNLIDRNLVIVTAAKESYDEITQEMRNRDFERGANVLLDHDFYSDPGKLQIFESLLDLSSKSHIITQRQLKWTRRLLDVPEERDVFRAIIRKWSPGDIERFVLGHLPRSKGPADIRKLLERNADLDNEIHQWFLTLDDSARCFVLALAMLSGLSREELWAKYKLIFKNLKKLDANLSLWPLGICRQRSAPYVTNEGQLDFVDERIAEVIYGEVTKNFREYLIELIPLMVELTIPPGREQKMTKELREARKLGAAETKELRGAFARVTGKAARHGLEDLTDILESWGADPVLSVREAVALSLEQAVVERVGARQALGLLESWCNETSKRNDALHRSWAASSALGSIVAARPGADTYGRALGLLERLAHRDRRNIKFYISISLKKAARKAPLTKNEASLSLEDLLGLVAQDDNFPTKINVGEALCQARIADELEALNVMQGWAFGEDPDRRWAAMCSVVLWRKQSKGEWNRAITQFLAHDAPTIASVLVETLNEKDQGIWEWIRQFLRNADDATLTMLIPALAGLAPEQLEKSLLPRLRTSESARLNNIAVQVRAERWRRMLFNPPEFLTDLQQVVHNDDLAGEIFAAFVHLLKPEPEGCRQSVIFALVSCFMEQRSNLEDVLTRLTLIGPDVFNPLSLEIRLQAFRSLFQHPAAFLAAITAGLSDPKIAAETLVALEMLARPEPDGHGDEMHNALTAAYATEASLVRALLHQFRAMNSSVLSNFSYQFNLRSLSSLLASPEDFVRRISEAMHDRRERAEFMRILGVLSRTEPDGRHGAVVRALGVTWATRPVIVNMLLQDSSWQTRSGFFSLSTEVKLFSFISSLISERFASRILALEP